MKLSIGIVRKYLETCEYQKRLNPKTLKAYRIDLRQFTEFMSDRGLTFCKEAVQDYISYLNDQYQPRTVKRKLASIRAFSTFLEEEELFEQNPFRQLRIKLQMPVQLPKTLSLRVVEDLLEAVHRKRRQGDRFALRDTAVMELLFATGARVSELCSLKTRDIDLTDGRVFICGKGAKERIIQITNPEVLTILRQYADSFQTARNGAFFLNRRCGRLSEQSVRLILRKYAKQAGIQTRVTPHMFRHSLATFLLEEDVDIRYIQQLLGHSSIVTTQIYTHVAGAKQRDIMAQKHPRNKLSFRQGGKPAADRQYTGILWDNTSFIQKGNR